MDPQTPETPVTPTEAPKAAAVKKVAAEKKSKPEPVEENKDPLAELQKSGFANKEEVLSYLKAVNREKVMIEQAKKELADEEKKIEMKYLELDKRSKDMDAKGGELQAKLAEYKTLVARNQEQITKLSSFNPR